MFCLQSPLEKRISALLREEGWTMDTNHDIIHPSGLRVRYEGYSECVTVISPETVPLSGKARRLAIKKYWQLRNNREDDKSRFVLSCLNGEYPYSFPVEGLDAAPEGTYLAKNILYVKDADQAVELILRYGK